MPEGEVEMGGTPQRAASSVGTPGTEPFDDAAALAAMGEVEVEMGTPRGDLPGTPGTEPHIPSTPIEYAIFNEKHDYKYLIVCKLHMIKKSYLEGLSKPEKIEIIFNMIKKTPERYKKLIETAMRREFDTYEEYLKYVTSDFFKTSVSTDEFQTLQGIVDYQGFINSFFDNLPGTGETDVSLNERIRSEIDEDRDIIDLNPDTSVARSLFARAKPSNKSSKKKSKKKKRKSKSKVKRKRKSKRSKRKSFKRYKRK